MRLNMLFIVMYLLTVLAYPIVFAHGKLRLFSKARQSIPPANVVVAIPVTAVR